jgi:tetratricopeptide (TPR) repeat protein
MALGFGFNKAKVLATAEKFVQQGKLQNAIAEYEKIVKEDPKDLTVLNTLGDLCVRVGQNEQAAQHFKRVGEHYAQDGFTVKAIAVYRKLSRLSPGNLENVNRLAELYSQQGLFSDARTHYMQVADQLLRSGDNAQAARALQKILELDPENTATQSKLADLFIKLGKRAEASKIFYTAAESLYHRSSFDAANEALNKVLAIDPQNSAALQLRGMIAADAGDGASAVQHLEQVSDLDSRPDALRALLRAKLQSKTADGAESIAGKLATVHNDLSGISTLAEWYVSNQQIGRALKLYENNCDRYMAIDRAGFEGAIYPLINRVKEDPEALSAMARLLQRVGDSSQSAEIMELQAHAFAQKGEFKAARDLYKKLAELEPDNSLHGQNYKQMLSKLGEDPTTRTLSPDEASQAFMVDELEQGAPVHQSYDPPTERAIEAALTDAELFVSYNVPAKAIPPLEAVLPLAPRDVTVNQRLATLYARSGRHADAARACQILSEVYRELGHESESARYLEASRNYARRVPASAAVAPAAPPPAVRAPQPIATPEAPIAAPPTPAREVAAVRTHQPAMEVELPAEQPGSSVQEFSFDVPDHLFMEPEPALAPPNTQPIAIEEMNVQAAPAPAKAQPAPSETEVDVSSEWENMLTVESSEPPRPSAVVGSATGQEAEQPEVESAADPAVAAAEKIQEAQFYIAQQMWDAAKKAILDLTEIAPDAHEITDLISAVSAGQARAAAPPAPAARTHSAPAVAAPKPAVTRPPEPPPVEAVVEQALPAQEFALETATKRTSAKEPVATERKKPPVEEFVIEAETSGGEVESEPVRAAQADPASKTAAASALQEIFKAPPAPIRPAAEPTPPRAKPISAPPPPPPPPVSKPQPSPAALAAVAEVFSAPAAPPPAPPPPAPATAAVPPSPPSRRPVPPPAPVAPVVPAVASAPQSNVALEEPLEDVLVVPVEIEAPHIHVPPAAVPSPAAAAPAPPTLPPRAVVPAPAATTAPVDDLLEDILDVELATASAAKPRQKPKDSKPKEKSTEDILSDFVSDMEKSDLADFVPRAKPDTAPAVSAPPLKTTAPEIAASTVSKKKEEELVLAPTLPTPKPLEPPAPVATGTSGGAGAALPVNGDMRDAESASVLTDILSELQQETTEESETEEDPETHYNLGIAFKEMGLLDEAIGELQKVCHAMDRGNSFSQPIQAYTWLAQCLVDKGAPEAAVRWYKRALQLPRLDDGSRCAIYYDLALAYEASGDKGSALANLMEVYGSNIDFRDVASRIKALKS